LHEISPSSADGFAIGFQFDVKSTDAGHIVPASFVIAVTGRDRRM
jgi:hypothetical protein